MSMAKSSSGGKRDAGAKPVWSHSGGAMSAVADMVLAYCAGRDVAGRPMADAALIPFDLWTNRAHCAMLCKQGIISGRDLKAIGGALDAIEAEWAKGGFALDPGLEDVHINIEQAVGRIAGEKPAGAMHTARSRNDQTATDIRLYMRGELLRLTLGLAGTVQALATFAKAERETVLAGWTHGQPAMPTTLGHWAAAHGFALARDLAALRDLWPIINISPLGSAAGFGTNWPIDREATRRWMGFDAPQANSLDAVSTRWEGEARLGFALAVMMTHLSSLAQDIYFLSSPPRRWLDLDAAFTTGSSIMPQKRNPDFAEVTRARAAGVQALVQANLSAGRGALSGYNRDSQWTKYWIMDLIDEVGTAPQVFAKAIESVKPNRDALAASAKEEFVSAVDLADHLASTRKVEFRKIYHVVGRSVFANIAEGGFQLETVNRELEALGIAPMSAAELREVTDPARALKKRKSVGGPSPAEVSKQSKALAREAAAAAKWAGDKAAGLAAAKDGLVRDLKGLAKG